MTDITWLPKKDISVYELAAALNVLLAGVAGVSKEDLAVLVRALPPDVGRHFELGD